MDKVTIPEAFTASDIAAILWRELPEHVRLFQNVVDVRRRNARRIEIAANEHIAGILQSPQCLPHIESVAANWFDCLILITDSDA